MLNEGDEEVWCY